MRRLCVVPVDVKLYIRKSLNLTSAERTVRATEGIKTSGMERFNKCARQSHLKYSQAAEDVTTFDGAWSPVVAVKSVETDIA